MDSLAHRVATSPSAFNPLVWHSDNDEPNLPGLAPFWTEQHGAGSAVETLQDSVEYDGWERVTRWVGRREGNSIGDETFSFDRMGNISASGGEVYNAVTGRLTARSGYEYYYNRAGNLDSLRVMSGGTPVHRWIYGWDALNRLVSVRYDGTLIVRYGYDVAGRRIAKRVYSSSTGGNVAYLRFIYQGSNVAYETDSAGTMGNRYTWGMGVDDLIGVRNGAQQHYTVKDKLGSIRGLVKRDGTWQYSERFAPYGQSVEIFGSDLDFVTSGRGGSTMPRRGGISTERGTMIRRPDGLSARPRLGTRPDQTSTRM